MNEERILVVSPHPDDETLGAGGTLLKYRSEGATTFWLNLTDMTEEYGYSQEKIQKRTAEMKEVASFFGFKKSFNLKLKPAHLFSYPETELIDKISAVVKEVQPTTMILPYDFDVHSDHHFAFQACYSCTKSFRYPSIKRILVMEIFSETDFALSSQGFVPNYFVNITDYMKKN